MKILVTGASGFIGQHVASYYMAQGHQVIGIVHNSNIKLEYKILEYDLLNCDWTALLTTVQPQLIIHCAGTASVPNSVKTPLQDFDTNTLMVYKLFLAMKQLEMQDVKVVFLSSAGVYGQPSELPIKEETLCYPKSPYALHKRMAEEICTYFISNYGFNIEILRVFSAYGPGLKKQIFWDMYQKVKNEGKLELWGTGKESRDYVYIDDLVNAIDLIINNSVYKNEIWNVANGKEITIEYAARVFLEKYGLDVSNIHFNNVQREGDPQNWQADISKLKEIGYCPRVAIEEGIFRYVDWVVDID